MANRAAGPGKGTSKGKRARLRLGPEQIERTVVDGKWSEPKPLAGPDLERAKEAYERHRQAEASGELYVDLPTQVLHLPTGNTVTVPEHFEHPLMTRLRELAVDFIAHAKEYTNDEAAAVGQILSATAAAIRWDDLAALNEGNTNPHAWARKYLARFEGGDAVRTADGQRIPIRVGHAMPFLQESKTGRRLNMAQISGGFVILERLIGAMFAADRRVEPLSAAELTHKCMRDNLPALKSLRDEESSVRARIHTMLEQLVSKHSKDLRDSDNEKRARAVEYVVEALVEVECVRSGIDPVCALDFLRKRKH